MSAEKDSSPIATVQLLAAELDFDKGSTEVLAIPSVPVRRYPNIFFPLPFSDKPIVLPKSERGGVFDEDGRRTLGGLVMSTFAQHSGRTHDRELSELNSPGNVHENEQRVFGLLGVTSMKELVEDRNARMISVALWRGQDGEERNSYRVYATHRFASDNEPVFRELVKPVAELPYDATVETLGAAINDALVESGRPIKTERF